LGTDPDVVATISNSSAFEPSTILNCVLEDVFINHKIRALRRSKACNGFCQSIFNLSHTFTKTDDAGGNA
jgi:hypothetical protein